VYWSWGVVSSYLHFKGGAHNMLRAVESLLKRVGVVEGTGASTMTFERAARAVTLFQA
jgi:hypothetical protein